MRNADPDTGTAEFLINGTWERRSIAWVEHYTEHFGRRATTVHPAARPGHALSPCVGGSWMEYPVPEDRAAPRYDFAYDAETWYVGE